MSLRAKEVGMATGVDAEGDAVAWRERQGNVEREVAA
jgi:hypothetical protein